MLSGYARHFRREPDAAGGVTADRDQVVREFLNLPFHGAMDMNQLHQ